jgi:hypothetical protein
MQSLGFIWCNIAWLPWHQGCWLVNDYMGFSLIVHGVRAHDATGPATIVCAMGLTAMTWSAAATDCCVDEKTTGKTNGYTNEQPIGHLEPFTAHP